MPVLRYKEKERELAWTSATTLLFPARVIKEIGKLSLGEALASLQEREVGLGTGKAHSEGAAVPRRMLGSLSC